jgi:hypothetical protein
MAVPSSRHPGTWFGTSPLSRPPQGPRREGFSQGLARTWQEALGLPAPEPVNAGAAPRPQEGRPAAPQPTDEAA